MLKLLFLNCCWRGVMLTLCFTVCLWMCFTQVDRGSVLLLHGLSSRRVFICYKINMVFCRLKCYFGEFNPYHCYQCIDTIRWASGRVSFSGDHRLSPVNARNGHSFFRMQRQFIVPHRMIMLVHWSLMGGLLHLKQRGGDWAGPQSAQAPPRCTKCNSRLINGQCTIHHI